ncbi:MAG: hypothetical protein HYZ75_01635 [Elusimicrobia bacterium]|nr:hypothetical protein [Elusimicrobiota bacterium]
MKKVPFLAAAALCASACSPSTVALRAAGRLIERGRPALTRESDPRIAEQALPGQLKLLEVLLESDPANPDLLASLAEGWTGYAYLFIEDADPARAAGLYKRAAGYGRRLLALKPAFAALDGASPEAAVSALASAGPADVRALYWTAAAWAGWANAAKSDPEALSALPRAVRLMERVLALDPGYENSGPDLFFGVYYAATPKIAGGDPARALKHFDAALARTERRYLPAQVMMMRHYAVAVLDEDLFRRLGAEVAAADPAALTDARLANEAARLKAKSLLEKTDDLF